MTFLPFGEWRPDVADYEGQHSDNIDGVLPQGDGYGPFPGATGSWANVLGASVNGLFTAIKNDGTMLVFVATTANRLYVNTGVWNWTDVSKGGVAYTAPPTGMNWQFAQFNNYVFAVQQNTAPQVYDMTSSSAFADLGGSPPSAGSIAIVNRFVVLSNVLSPNGYRIQWSGLNATTTWTSGVSQSDYQDIADGGLVRGVVGGEYGTILQDYSIRRMNFAPGSPYVFSIERIAQNDGVHPLAMYSAVQAGDRIFFYSPSGFKMLLPGGYPIAIGKEKIDRTFYDDYGGFSSVAQSALFIGIADTHKPRVYWSYPSNSATTGQFDKILVYDWQLERWSRASVTGEYLGPLATSTGSGSQGQFDIGIVNTSHRLQTLTGSNLAATLDTAQHSAGGRRIFVRGFRPITDASNVKGQASQQETESDVATYGPGTAKTVGADGMIPIRFSTRFSRARITIPAAASWTYASGVEPDIAIEGEK